MQTLRGTSRKQDRIQKEAVLECPVLKGMSLYTYKALQVISITQRERLMPSKQHHKPGAEGTFAIPVLGKLRQ